MNIHSYTDYTELYMDIHTYTPGYTQLYIAIHRYTWLYTAINSYTWIYTAIRGYTQLYMAIHSYTVRLFFLSLLLKYAVLCNNLFIVCGLSIRDRARGGLRGLLPPFPFLVPLKNK